MAQVYIKYIELTGHNFSLYFAYKLLSNLPALNLFRCRHFKNSSERLLSIFLWSARIIKSFSVRHKLHRKSPALRGVASYDREIKDLTFFYKALFGFVNVDLSNFVSFVNHGRTRLSRSSDKILQTPLCKTTTFQSSYYNRIVKIWNTVTQEVSPESFSRPSSFKCYLKRKYLDMIDSNYDVDKSCTWSLIRDCPCHRS